MSDYKLRDECDRLRAENERLRQVAFQAQEMAREIRTEVDQVTAENERL